MKYLIINSVAGHTSTGKISAELYRDLVAKGNQCVLAYGRWAQNCDDIETYRIGTSIDYTIHGICTRLFDRHGFCSKHATKAFVKWIEVYDPDVIWLHNLHGYYINIEILFEYLKRANKTVRWTLHDCWAFTGHCPHFTIAHCDQWKTGCENCCQLKRYPSCIGVGNVKNNYLRKRKAFCGVQDLTIVTPSKWLRDLVKQSFLKDYPVEVVHNKVDHSVFKPTPSNFRQIYHLEDKYIILGVANGWGKHKGLQDFYKLSEMLDHNKYVVVLVGLTKAQLKTVPDDILGLPRTSSTQELAEIYTAANVLVSASKEETFGMTPLEAKACGTPSIVYSGTACEEVAMESGNIVVSQSPEALYKAIITQL